MIQELEVAACELGYTSEQIDRIVGTARREEFNRWMAGQTGAICEGRRYNYATKEYEPTGCGPHGAVIYGHDLKRFLRGQGPLD